MVSIAVQYSADQGSTPCPASKVKKVFRSVVCFFLCFSLLLFVIPVQAAFVVDDVVVLGSLIFTLAAFGVSIKAVNLFNDSDMVAAFDDLFYKADVPFSWQNQQVSVAAPGTLKVGKEIVTAVQNLAAWIKGEVQEGSSSVTLLTPVGGQGYITDSGLPISFGTPHRFSYNYGYHTWFWDNVGSIIPYESFADGINLHSGDGGLDYSLIEGSSTYSITTRSGTSSLGVVAPGQSCVFYSYSIGDSQRIFMKVWGRPDDFVGQDFTSQGSMDTILLSRLGVELSDISTLGLVADVSFSSLEVEDQDLYVATPSSFLSTDQMASDAFNTASATDVPVTAVGSATLDDVLNVQAQLLEGVTSIQAAISAPDPMESPDFQAHPLADIWHYVTDWLNSVEDFLVLYATIFNGLPYIIRLPFYAAVVLFLYAGIIRKLVGV